MSREQHYRAIWQEGSLVDGVHRVARLVTVAIGVDLADACRSHAISDPIWARGYEPSDLTHEGRRLFLSYEEARKAFG